MSSFNSIGCFNNSTSGDAFKLVEREVKEGLDDEVARLVGHINSTKPSVGVNYTINVKDDPDPSEVEIRRAFERLVSGSVDSTARTLPSVTSRPYSYRPSTTVEGMISGGSYGTSPGRETGTKGKRSSNDFDRTASSSDESSSSIRKKEATKKPRKS